MLSSFRALPIALVGTLLVSIAGVAQSDARSQFCHATDGVFTVCPDGHQEWSDVPTLAAPESSSYLYADQADLDPELHTTASPVDTFMLLYDNCKRRLPLGPNEYSLLSFTTVELEDGAEHLEHYAIHIFSDGTFIFIENGVPQANSAGDLRVREIEGQHGQVGFGPSPNCPFDHVIAEFDIKLTAASGELFAGAYSPDPQFWSSDEPPVHNAVALFTGFSASSGPTSGMEEIRQRLLTFPDDVIAARRFGHTQERAAVRFLKAQAEQGAEIVIIGHSFGADSAIEVAQRLNAEGIRVGKLVQLDSIGIGDDALPDNVDVGLNYFQTSGTLQGEQTVNGSTNVNAPVHLGITPADLSHTDIDNNATLQREIVDFKLNGTLPSGSGITSSQQLTPAAVTLQSPSRSVSISDPITILGASGLTSARRWDSGVVALPTPLVLSGRDGGIIDVTFSDPVTLFLVDNTGVSSENLTIEMFGTATAPDNATNHDRVQVEFQFDDLAEENQSNQVSDEMLLPLGSSSATLEKVVELTESAFHFGGFALQLLQNGTGETQVTAIRVAVGADDISVEPRPHRAIRPGFDTNELAGNDDESTGVVALDFAVNFFGSEFTSLFVNNNGNVTFGESLGEYTPFDLTATERVIIAPFFADVDTRAGNTLTYGSGTVDGHHAFGATWPGVGCFARNNSVLNYFQLLLIERSDRAAGDFDIELNYDSIEWETGSASGGNALCQGGTSARAGFSNGSGVAGTFFELEGSGTPGSFLDDNQSTALVAHSLNSDVLGRYVFEVRSGRPQTQEDADDDGVSDELDNCPRVANADQSDANLNGIGDICEDPGHLHSTAAFLQALEDGETAVEATSLKAAEEPSLAAKLARIVEFRVESGLASSADTVIANLIASLVESGLIAPDESSALQDAVRRLLDDDADGVPNDEDRCPASDLRPRIVISGCDSNVQNMFAAPGCTVLDVLGACAREARNHGAYVSCVADMLNSLKRQTLLTGQQCGRIQSCAARARLP